MTLTRTTGNARRSAPGPRKTNARDAPLTGM
jgi:hypothetical protein